MKKIFSLVSLCFLLVLAALPGQALHAAAAANDTSVTVTKITLKTDKGDIQAVKKGDNFTVDLVGLPASQKINEVDFTANSADATTLSFMPFDLSSDDTDLHFVNGVATLDKAKFENWFKRIGTTDPSIATVVDSNASNLDQAQLDAFTNQLFTVQGLRSAFDQKAHSDVVTLYTDDVNGNETQFDVNFLTESWKYQDNHWYYYKNDGSKATGWLNYKNKKYYLNSDGTMATGWVKVSGKWYFFDKTNGDIYTGWVLDKNKKYYLNSDGTMATGWVKVSGKWYFFDKTNGDMKTGWVLDGKKRYYLNSNGSMATGWVKVSGKWYFLDKTNGDMKTGWVYDAKKWYYLNGNGAMVTGWYKVGNKLYYFYSDGHMR